MQKVVSVSRTGRLRKTTAYRQSTDSRIKQLIKALGIDENEYRLKASFRKYQRMANNSNLFNN